MTHPMMTHPMMTHPMMTHPMMTLPAQTTQIHPTAELDLSLEDKTSNLSLNQIQNRRDN
jgi:hypothetical protein